MNIQQLLDSSVEFTTNLIRSMEAQHSQAVKHGDADALGLCADTWAATMKEVNEKNAHLAHSLGDKWTASSGPTDGDQAQGLDVARTGK